MKVKADRLPERPRVDTPRETPREAPRIEQGIESVQHVDGHVAESVPQHGASEQARALIDTGASVSPTFASKGPSSWVAVRAPPEDAQRRTLKALSKLLDAPAFDATQLAALARAAIEGGYADVFSRALAPRADRVLDGVLDGSRALPDVHGALELLQEALPPAAYLAVAAHVAPLVRDEIASLGVLSDEIMKLPRGADGRATQRAVDKVEHELVPRVRVLRELVAVAELDLHALLATRAAPDARAPSATVNKALTSIAARRHDASREISVHVSSRSDAEAVLGAWLKSEALVDTSAMSPTLVKHLLGRARTFHWDDTFGKDGIITGHYPGSDHGLLPHLQIHTADGQEVRVFFPKEFARTEEGA